MILYMKKKEVLWLNDVKTFIFKVIPRATLKYATTDACPIGDI